jgi:hypothetical protein
MDLLGPWRQCQHLKGDSNLPGLVVVEVVEREVDIGGGARACFQDSHCFSVVSRERRLMDIGQVSFGESRCLDQR